MSSTKISITNTLLQDLEKLAKSEIDKTKKKVLEALIAATPVDTGEARAGWRIEGDKIVNDVEHISHLNKGSSQQAPAHFIEKAALSVSGVKPAGLIVKEKT